MTEITDALDGLFTNAEKIIEELGKEFTFQDFLVEAMHDQQHAYIDLLNACYHLTIPFDQAHQNIGRRLSKVAKSMGYEKQSNKAKDTNIFRNDTETTVYKK